ncbi:MAG: RNA polymerase sigma factor [Patescibacteria group bacterium]
MSTYFSEHNRLNRLAKRMQKGDRRAAEALYEELFGKVYGFCLSRVRRRPLAEDLTQEIFLKLVNRVETFDSAKGSFAVWFWQLARNTVFDHYRKQKEVSFSDVGDGEESDVEHLSVHNPWPAFEARFENDRLRAFLGDLQGDEQELFRLRFVADLSYREIAVLLERSEPSLRVAVSRLKRKIKENFQHEI